MLNRKQAILSFVMLLGLIGWAVPVIYGMNKAADLEVEHLLLPTAPDRSD